MYIYILFIYVYVHIYTYRLPGSLWKAKDGPKKKLNRKGLVALPGQYGQPNLGEALHLQRQICPAKNGCRLFCKCLLSKQMHLLSITLFLPQKKHLCCGLWAGDIGLVALPSNMCYFAICLFILLTFGSMHPSMARLTGAHAP
jgi:hypothetical protein